MTVPLPRFMGDKKSVLFTPDELKTKINKLRTLNRAEISRTMTLCTLFFTLLYSRINTGEGSFEINTDIEDTLNGRKQHLQDL